MPYVEQLNDAKALLASLVKMSLVEDVVLLFSNNEAKSPSFEIMKFYFRITFGFDPEYKNGKEKINKVKVLGKAEKILKETKKKKKEEKFKTLENRRKYLEKLEKKGKKALKKFAEKELEYNTKGMSKNDIVDVIETYFVRG